MRTARRAEWPWIVAMVGYTMTSLWLLAQPVVQDTPSSTPKAAAAALITPADAESATAGTATDHHGLGP